MPLPPSAYAEFEQLRPLIIRSILLWYTVDKHEDPLDVDGVHVGEATTHWFNKYDRAYMYSDIPCREEIHIGMHDISALVARLNRMLFLTQEGTDGQDSKEQGSSISL